jgi:uncharacterized protein (DUF2147 family)
MRPLLLAALLAAPLALAAAPTAALAVPDAAFGEWLNQDGKGRIAMAPCSTDPALACGAISWLKEAAKDDHNPDPALRGRPLVGVLVVRAMKNQGPGRWAGGKLYDPESGKSYDGRMKVLTGNRMQVTGCILMLCQNQTWTRP